MRLVAFGILAATMLLGAGCALQAGDPGGEPGGTPTELTASDSTPKLHQAAMSPQGAASATPPNPEPSPWVPTGPGGPGLSEDSTGNNPEPSPWQPAPPTAGEGLTGDPQAGGAGATTGSTTPNRPGHTGRL